jgi:glycosyltransferase involved in cell wall biosynthesis
MLGAIAAYREPVARVITVVSPPSQDFGQSHQRWKSIKRKLLAASYRTATSLLAVSQESANDAARFYDIPLDRWTIVPSPIDLTLVQSNAAAQPPENFRRFPGLNIAIIGRLSAEKNHEFLFNILADLKRESKQVHLHVIGDGILREKLQMQTHHLGIASDVTFYGVQSNPHAIAARCDCLALPSLYEGFPNVIMEAMACRIPVIASNRAGGLKDLIGENERGILLAPDNAATWKRHLETLDVHSPAIQHTLQLAADYVSAHHDLPKWMHQMEDIFISAADKFRDLSK